tara:strand:+ start:503 stop:646 length:144 start_codon:yes stop_codon:yes gene_type:complete
MRNAIDEEDDKLGKTINNINRFIIAFELIGLGILVYMLSWSFTDCGG